MLENQQIFNLITGLLKPDFGSILINGVNVVDYPIALRASKFQIGYCPQYGGYFHDLTLLENLKAIGEIQIPNTKERNIMIDQLYQNLNLIVLLTYLQNFYQRTKEKISNCFSIDK